MKINVSFLAALLLVGTGLVARAAMQGIALPQEALVNASGGKSDNSQQNVENHIVIYSGLVMGVH